MIFGKLNSKKKFFRVLFILLIITIFKSDYIMGSVVNKSFVDIKSPAAIVIDYSTGRILFEKNIHEKRSIASLTKILTSVILVENCKMDEMVKVPNEAVWQGGSDSGLVKGEMVSVKALLYAMLLPSGNDAAYTVAVHIGGTVENFAKIMNEKAKSIGALDSNFVRPNGLDDDQQYSSAYDIAVITKYALKNEYINEAVKTRSIELLQNGDRKTFSFTNTNALLKTYKFADGVKTGYTDNANRCLVSSATKDNMRIIAVVLGAENTEIRFDESKMLLEESFNRYKMMDISKYMNWYVKIPINKGVIDYYEEYLNEKYSYPLTQEEYDSIIVKQDIVQRLDAPVKEGMNIGDISLYLEDEKVYGKNLILNRNIRKNNIWDYMKEGYKNMFKEYVVI